MTPSTLLQSLDQEFKDADERLVVLEFYADWCDPCKAIGPKINVSLTCMKDLWGSNTVQLLSIGGRSRGAPGARAPSFSLKWGQCHANAYHNSKSIQELVSETTQNK